jgi:signal transduction histidine kinase
VQIFGAAFCLTVEGAPRSLRPLIAEEIERIGGEALNNAFRHARANRVDVQIQYAPDSLSLRVSDDGAGFEVAAWNDHVQAEHWGLMGMRERARTIRAQLEVTSRPGQGTAVKLHVRGSIAFERSATTQRRWLWLLLGKG